MKTIAKYLGKILSFCFNWFRKWLMEEQNNFIKQLLEDNKEIHKELRSQKVALLKSIIFNKSMPLKERVIAGEIYVNELGENGETKAQYYMLREKLEENLKKEEEK